MSSGSGKNRLILETVTMRHPTLLGVPAMLAVPMQYEPRG
jgi:hypothetical protein